MTTICFLLAGGEEDKCFLLGLEEVHSLGLMQGERGGPCPSPQMPELKWEEAKLQAAPWPAGPQ